MQKKISVIVPCYNVERWIDRCVRSLVRQTIGIKNLELIFVDDASTDQTLERLKVWKRRFPDEIIVISCKENGRQGTARNIGMRMASGEYIGFVDSDDYVSEEMYQALYEVAVGEDCDAVGCLFVREYNDGTVAGKAEPCSWAGKKYLMNLLEERWHEMTHHGMPGGIWCKIFRRECIMKNELWFPEHLRYEDNFWGKFAWLELSSFYLINEYFYHYMINETSTIMQMDACHHLDRLKIELMKLEEYRKRNLFDKYHADIEMDFLQMYFLNTIRILFVRFTEIPYEAIYKMQEVVKREFPNYMENPGIAKLPPLQQELLKIVEAPLTDEKIDALAEGYRKVLEEHVGG